MSDMASQIDGISTFCPTVCFGTHQRKHKSSVTGLCEGNAQVTGGFLQKGKYRGKRFYLMTPLCHAIIAHSFDANPFALIRSPEIISHATILQQPWHVRNIVVVTSSELGKKETKCRVSNVNHDVKSIANWAPERFMLKMTGWHSRPQFNIKMTSYQYRKSHCGDKTILRPSYLRNGISYTGKMISLYWIRAQSIITTIEPLGLFEGFYVC